MAPKKTTSGSDAIASTKIDVVAGPSLIDSLPPEFARNRVFGSEDSAAYLGYSVPHFRRLYRAGKVPKPIKIGDRKYGWRIGDLADFAASRASALAAA